MQTHIAYLSLEQKARPIGVRIVEPPVDTRQAVRGRLYAIVELANNQPEDAQLVERALSVIQRTYYSVKGTQTFVLTEALREALNLFQEGVLTAQPKPPSVGATREQESQGNPSLPGILLLSLIDNRLVLVGTGPAVAFITAGSNVDVYPPYAPGVARDLQSAVDIYRQEFTYGGAFLLAGQRCLQHFTLKELASIVAYMTEDNVASVATALRSQAGADALTGLLTVVTPDEADEPATAASPTSVPPKPLVQSKRRGGLPAALSIPPPLRDLTQQTRHSSNASDLPSQGQQRTEPEHDYEDYPAPASHSAGGEQEPLHSNQALLPGSGDRIVRSDPSSINRLVTDVTDSLKRRWAQGATFFRSFSPLEGASKPTSATEVDNRRTSADPDHVDNRVPAKHIEQAPFDPHADPYAGSASASQNRPLSRWGASPSADSAGVEPSFDYPYTETAVVADLDDAGDVEEQDPAHLQAAGSASRSAGTRVTSANAGRSAPGKNRATGRRARLFALAALLILLLTVVIVASVSWVTGSRNVAEAERTLDMAQASFLSAQSALDTGDKSTARLRLTEAQDLINQATLLVGSRLDRADQLNSQIEQELAGLLQIYPLQALTVPLVQFPPEAQPQRVIVSDQDIYVLDTGRQLIQHFELDPTRNLVLNTAGETVLAQGDSIDGLTVGRLVDITWLPPIAGVDDKAYLLVLDGTNNIFRYDRRVEGASRLDLGGRTDLLNPVQLRVYGDRLYLADAGSNQLYRYARGNFAEAPERWFGPQTQSDLGSLRSMAIDGDIWLLYEQGLLLRYRTGDQMQFSLETSFGQINDPVDIAVGDQGNSMIYIADSAEERILVFNKDGEYERQLRAPEGDVLRNLRGISVDEIAGTMYILTQSFLFNHPLPN